MDHSTTPHNSDAEHATVAAAIVPQPPEQRAALLATVDPGDFYDHTHGDLFATIRRLHDNGTPITIPTILDTIDRNGPGRNITRQTLNDLFLTGSTIHQIEHAHIVHRDAQRRRALLATNDLANLIINGNEWGDHLAHLATMHTATLTTGNLGIVDLTKIDDNGPRPLLGHIDGGTPLFYPAAIHDLHGEPSVGKTWIALWAAIESLHAGHGAMLIDYEDTAATCRARLTALGATLEDLTRFVYIPGRTFTDSDLDEIRTRTVGLDGGPVIIDAVAPALAADGLDENSNTDVTLWIGRIPRTLARTGSPIIMLDHVGKSKIDRARGARGAGAKLAAIDGASYEITGTGFSRTQPGTLKTKIAKDRHGHVGPVGAIAAEITITPTGPDTIGITTNHPASPITPTGTFRPTGIMESISRWAAQHDGPWTIGYLIPKGAGTPRPVAGKNTTIRAALTELVNDGHLQMDEGTPPNGNTYTHVSTFLEDQNGWDSTPPESRQSPAPRVPRVPGVPGESLKSPGGVPTTRHPVGGTESRESPPLKGDSGNPDSPTPTIFDDDEPF